MSGHSGFIRIERGGLRLAFDYDPEAVEAVKELVQQFGQSKAFNPETKEWKLPMRALEAVMDKFPHFGRDKEVDDAYHGKLAQAGEEFENRRKFMSILNETMEGTFRTDGAKLWKHQREACLWLASRHGGILADEMGLGKSAVAIFMARVWWSGFKVRTVVVARAGLHANWLQEISLANAISCVELYSWAKIGCPSPPYVLVADEGHLAQNLGSDRTQKFLDVAADAAAVYILTGTPMRNGRPRNLFPLLKAIKHPLGNNRTHYEKHYCDAHESAFSTWDTSGAANLEELKEKTRDAMLRRTKEECLDLPPKVRKIREIEPTNNTEVIFRTAFSTALQKFRNQYDDDNPQPDNIGAVILGILRSAASACKVNIAKELAWDLWEDGDQRSILFTAYRYTAERLATALGCKFVHGGVHQDTRWNHIQSFQRQEEKFLVLTLGAGSEGLNLTAASAVILMDRPLVPDDVEQAEARAHRPGQHWPVTCYWLQAFAVDKEIDAQLLSKNELNSKLLGQPKVDSWAVLKKMFENNQPELLK